jgi:hypothetical protein
MDKAGAYIRKASSPGIDGSWSNVVGLPRRLPSLFRVGDDLLLTWKVDCPGDTRAARGPAVSHPDRFIDRHIGPRQADLDAMLQAGCRDMDS